jgi:hypothetical protein
VRAAEAKPGPLWVSMRDPTSVVVVCRKDSQDDDTPFGHRVCPSGSVAFSCAIGAVAGAALTGRRGAWTRVAGTVAGAVGLAVSEAVARA